MPKLRSHVGAWLIAPPAHGLSSPRCELATRTACILPPMPSPPDPSSPLPAPWWSEFHSFTLQHALALAWTLPLIIISCYLGRKWRSQGDPESISREKQLCAAWAGFIICVNIWSLFYWLQPEHYDIKQSLPLQMCDIGTLLAPLLFLTHWRPIRSIMYFWGIGLSTQAFITPTLLEGIGHPRYWIFWLGHLAIVGSTIYDVIVRRFRPTFGDFLSTTIITIIWYTAVGLLNTQLHSNYGYSGNIIPTRPTIIDKLGPYPARVFIVAAIVIVLFAILWAIWPLSARLKKKSESHH